MVAIGDFPGTNNLVDGQPPMADQVRASSVRWHLSFLASLALAGATTYALWRDRPWSRHALLAFWMLVFVAPGLWELASTRDPEVLVVLLPWTAVVLWYLFRKRSIVAYYRAIAAGHVVTTA